MSEPKRFDYLSGGMWENSAGDFVLHSDYASLKAEVERLRKDTSMMLSVYSKHYERLRKAGDEMHRAIKVSDPILDWKIELWKAAKEGKPGV